MAPAAVAVGTMKVPQVSKPGVSLHIVEREIPEPGAGQVRIRVQACGICRSDVLTKEGMIPGIQYPRIRARGGTCHRRSRCWSFCLEEGAACRGRLARRPR